MNILLAKEPGLLVTAWGREKLKAIDLGLAEGFYLKAETKQIAERLTPWLIAYSEGILLPLPLLLDLNLFSPFIHRVLEELERLSFAEVLSYKDLAIRAGVPDAIRAVGSACGKNPYPLLLGCHRIVRANGKIGDFACGAPIKKALLDFEKRSIGMKIARFSEKERNHAGSIPSKENSLSRIY